MTQYQIVVIAPDADSAAGLVVSGAAGAPWGVAVAGATAEAMQEDPRYVAVSVPDAARDALDRAFPGSPWRQLASGIDVLQRWRTPVLPLP